MTSFDLLLSEQSQTHSQYVTETGHMLSAWSRSSAKRSFDVVCVLCTLPFSLPLLLAVGFAVRLSSRGPILFRQQRVGRNGRPFTIFKFRTMPVADRLDDRPTVTTAVNQQFTPIGRFLRNWKLDELPQILNVFRGEMSLVGPRPKLANHQLGPMLCRPGITGRATHAFAREELLLAAIPREDLDQYYFEVVLPFKQTLDDQYMARATFMSDLVLLVKSALGK